MSKLHIERGYGEVILASALNNQDLWAPGGTQPEPDTNGYTPYVISSSANDTAAGTGMQAGRIDYLNTNGLMVEGSFVNDGVTESVCVDGAGDIINDCMFVNAHSSSAVGSNIVAVGNVDILAGSGGSVVSRVAAAGNRSLAAMRQVPDGFALRLEGWHASATAPAASREALIRIRASEYEGISTPGVYHFLDTVRLSQGPSGWLPFVRPIIIPSLAVLKISTWTTNAINVSGSWGGELIRK